MPPLLKKRSFWHPYSLTKPHDIRPLDINILNFCQKKTPYWAYTKLLVQITHEEKTLNEKLDADSLSLSYVGTIITNFKLFSLITAWQHKYLLVLSFLVVFSYFMKPLCYQLPLALAMPAWSHLTIYYKQRIRP